MSEPQSVLASELPAALRKENDETRQLLSDLISQFTELCDQIAFVSTAIAVPASELESSVAIQVQDANDKRMILGDNKARRITVTVDSGSASDKKVSADGVTFVDGPINLNFAKGEVTVFVQASSTGTLVLALSDPDSTGLTLGGNATFTFS